MSSSFPEQTSDIPLPPANHVDASASNTNVYDYGLAASSSVNTNGDYSVAATAYYNAYAIAAASAYQYNASYYMQMNGLGTTNNQYGNSSMVSNSVKNSTKNTSNSSVNNYSNGNSTKQQHNGNEDDEEDDDPTIDKGGKKAKVNNNLPIWGNEKTMNLNPLVLTNIQNSPYFKVNLYALKTYHEVIDEIWYQVRHLEPWEKGSRRVGGQTGMCGSVRGVGAGGIVSTAFCILYKLYTLRLTRRQVVGLLKHKDSPFIRAIGFLYIRYTQPPEHLWSWYENYLDDKEEVDVKAGGGEKMTIGQIVKHLLLKLDWFSTLFPRIPVPIQKDIEKKFNEYKQNYYYDEEEEETYEDNSKTNDYDDNNEYNDDEDRDYKVSKERNSDDYRSRKSSSNRHKSERDNRNDHRHSRSYRRSRSNERRKRKYSRSRSRDRSRERRHDKNRNYH